MEQKELNEILEKHKHWINEDCKGWENMRANLAGADLAGAYLGGANLTGAKGLSNACPTHGSFIGWKKARKTDNTFTVTLVKLLIPEDAKRSSATSAKCRCNKAQVLEITSLDGKESYDTTTSSYDKTFIYKVGETESVEDFCEDRFEECAAGIHFFVDRDEAINY